MEYSQRKITILLFIVSLSLVVYFIGKFTKATEMGNHNNFFSSEPIKYQANMYPVKPDGHNVESVGYPIEPFNMFNKSVATNPTECSTRLRQARLRQRCHEHSWHKDIFEGNKTTLLSHFQVHDERRIIYCNIAKSGSTSFKFLMTLESLLDLENITELDPHPHLASYLNSHGVRNLNRYTVQEARYRLENYFTFIVVRHPFSRLLAAYRYAIHGVTNAQAARHDVENYYKGQVHIDNLTLSQFLELLVKRTETFKNIHWRDYYDLCFPCDIRYDHIIKLENLHQDIKPVISRMFGPDAEFTGLPNLSRKYPVPPELRDANIVFREQHPDIVRELMKIYHRDFELWGYNWTLAGGMQCGGYQGYCGENTTCI